MEIVVTGYAGLYGSLQIYHEQRFRTKLLERYSESFFGVLERGDDPQSEAAREALRMRFAAASEAGTAADSADGGVLAALWRVCKQQRCGGVYALREIPVRQQTIEICEMFALNPYRLTAPGCVVWLTTDERDRRELIDAAAGAGVPSAVIGYTAKGVAIRRSDTEGDSSLRRPEQDEIRTLFPAQ